MGFFSTGKPIPEDLHGGGDSGYDTHFAEIGKRFPDIDLAILENGQYNEDWKYIHTMPQYLEQVAKDLNPQKVLTVHHSKYALARHRWDEPINNALKMKKNLDMDVLIPKIGEIVDLKKEEQTPTNQRISTVKVRTINAD